MQSLSLNVEVLNAEGVTIDMKDETTIRLLHSDDLGFNIGARPDAAAKRTRCGEPGSSDPKAGRVCLTARRDQPDET